MFGYLAVVLLAAGLFWLDPILQTIAPGLLPEAPDLRRTPRPPIDESLLALEDDRDISGSFSSGSLGSLDISNSSDNSDSSDSSYSCPPDTYSVHLFSKAPLVLYLENFLSAAERRHLLEISSPLYTPATITNDGGGSVQRDVTVRDSEVAVVPRTAVVRCIEARARSLQGWRDDLWIERLRVQRYVAPTGHYGFHFDWSRSGASTGGWGRVSSIMVFVDDGELSRADESTDSEPREPSEPSKPQEPLVGGGTFFPRLPRRSSDPRWCRFIGCGSEAEVPEDEQEHGEPNEQGGPSEEVMSMHAYGRDNATGVVFQPMPGNAVLWENFKPDGTGRAYEETWHAGLRVRQGVKVGLNIWSWGRVD